MYHYLLPEQDTGLGWRVPGTNRRAQQGTFHYIYRHGRDTVTAACVDPVKHSITRARRYFIAKSVFVHLSLFPAKVVICDYVVAPQMKGRRVIRRVASS